MRLARTPRRPIGCSGMADAQQSPDSERLAAQDGLTEGLARLRRLRLVSYLGAASIVVILIVVALIPVPFVRLSPGPMYNTVGNASGVDLIKISGTRSYPTTGELDLVTVNERGGPFGGLTLPEALVGWLDSDDRVVPVDALYPPGTTAATAREENSLDFTTSQSSATAAALKHLDIPVATKIVVGLVIEDGPAQGKLEVGDVITAVNGKKVTKIADVPALVGKNPPGSTVTFDVVRGSTPTEVQVVTGESPRDPNRSYVGIQVGADYKAPFTIDFGLQDVGGPSAGMMFSLGIIDKLTPADLSGGRSIAGTGTINADGEVGPIGGIEQKLAAARRHGTELFLAPAQNCAQVNAVDLAGLNVARVSTLDEAVSVIDRWRAGVSDLPRCG